MNKYGQIPPRNLESFGVAGLLAENCQVFYSVLFSTRHVGKVSDLLAAKLKDAGVEDFQIRMAVLAEIFEVAYAIQGPWKTPINVECGLDDEKAAIGVSFVLPPEIEIDPAGFVAAIGPSENPLIRLSFFLREACDRLIIRYEPTSRRYETCVLIPLTGVLNLEERAIPAPPTFLTLTPEQAGVKTPKAGVYTELGDVEYQALLQDEKAQKEGKPVPPSAGERIAAAAQEETVKQRIQREAEVAEEESQKVKGKPVKTDDSSQKISGKSEEDNSKSKVTGKKQGEDDSKTKVSGEREENDDSVKRFSADPNAEEEKKKVEGEQGPGIVEKIMDALGLGGEKKPAAVPPKTKMSGEKGGEEERTVIKGDSEELLKSKEKIKALEEKIAKLQAEALKRSETKKEEPQKKVFKADPKEKVIEEKVVFENGKKIRKKKVVKEPAEEAAPSDAAALAGDKKEGEEGPGILEKIMDALGLGGKNEAKKPAKKEPKKEEIVEIVEEVTDEEEGDAEKAKESKEAEKPAVTEGEVEILKEAAKDAESIVKQSESLDEAIKRAKQESASVKDELKTQKAKKWVDNFMQDVIQEKAKIQDMAKKMNLSIRQKEFEFKNKERQLQEEVRKRDEELKTKSTALMRAKERMTQLQAAMDQAKGRDNKQDEAYKQKYAGAQKLLSQTKEQNTALSATIADLKVQISQLKQRSGGNSSQFTELKQKFDRSQKQIDEYKKMNQQLLDKLNEAGSKKAGGTGSIAVEEMKKKMENAIKLAQEQKAETETLKIKVEELEAESNRLKRELEVASKPAA